MMNSVNLTRTQRRVLKSREKILVVFALGVDATGPTSLFSDATKILITAMQAAGVRRLVAITGIGAGETRGHGGLIYDWIIFPLFTRHRYADKDRQEALIEASGLDWVIVRPAPFDRAFDARIAPLHRSHRTLCCWYREMHSLTSCYD